ncbi:MAG TPA: hypothetical protein PKM65_09460 [Spirochaetota bacterium]|nr:hypothetical protein [Spirochaetota bacterium]HNT12744.1 hypothetical protein [Spirochaetota bacterium]
MNECTIPAPAIQSRDECLVHILTILRNNKEIQSRQDEAFSAIADYLVQLERNSTKRFADIEQTVETLAKTTDERIQQAYEKVNHVREPKFEYVNLAKLGYSFNPSVGAKTMGVLLRKVGLARRDLGDTSPCREFIENKLAMSRAGENYATFNWHLERTLAYIDEWLKERNLFEEFYSCREERKLERFIKEL